MLNKIIKYFLHNRLITFLLLSALIGWGLVTAPFDYNISLLPSDPVAVDAIPNIGENQQIVFTQWNGRSPQDIDDQITYPLTTYLLGIPAVKSIRSSSILGFSSIYIIFDEDVEFYWSRTRILEKLNSIPSGLLPEGVQPTLGPDATALGQVYWYTLEGRDQEGNPTGGWNLDEVRSVQDFYVKYGLNATEGVSEIASIGGYVKEYQIDVKPAALKRYNLSILDVMRAVKSTNQDVGAKTTEINQVEYLIRGIGYVKSIEDIEKAVVSVKDNTPIRVKELAQVKVGPASRRGILDKDGAQVVGGVVVARYGENPLQVIKNVKAKIEEISPGLPQKKLSNGTVSKLTIVPFYDRSELIYETLGTLEEALSLEILISILVVIVMVYNLRASFLISSLLPIAVLMVFIAMRYVGITANIVALSGIAIAIGTMVDLGIILSENIVKKLESASKDESLLSSIYKGSAEVSGAIVTAVSTTIISFIPVFTMEAAEGKLFGPLAYTKTFALIAALIGSLLILPTLAYWFFGSKIRNRKVAIMLNSVITLVGLTAILLDYNWAGSMLMAFGIFFLLKHFVFAQLKNKNKFLTFIEAKGELVVSIIGVCWLLSKYWLPLGAQNSQLTNFTFVSILLAIILTVFNLLQYYYRSILNWCLSHKKQFFIIPTFLMLMGIIIWLGFNTLFGFVAQGFNAVGISIDQTTVWRSLNNAFPGVGEEFMPALDEGSFLLMPTSMPHSGIEFNKNTLAQLDMLLSNIPEVELTVGKAGRVESALDPAPISMFENVINYKSEYATDTRGRKIRFKTNDTDEFILKNGKSVTNKEALEQNISVNRLIPDDDGIPFRNWRNHIQKPDDIWQEIIKVTKLPGVTSAPKLQPIETRLVMLQTGMRAPMGIKIYGPDLETIQAFGLKLEEVLKSVPAVKNEAVFAERIVGKPYIHLAINRDKIARYGLSIAEVQEVIEVAIGGKQISTTVEGRERYPIRVRYPRELRDTPEMMRQILVPTINGYQIPLDELVTVEYKKGPQAIKSEETFLVGYVLFDRIDEFSEVEVVNAAKNEIQDQIDSGKLQVPSGISYSFSGNYENQVRAEKRLSIIVPLVLALVFMILYFQFKSVGTAFMIFTGIALAFSGGFILIWLYDQSWFLNFSIAGIEFRDLFQIKTINLSVAVWVGFIALFGIATDDGVLMATYLDQSFRRNKTSSLPKLRSAIIEAGQKRIRPAVMTTVTTIIALLPILTSSGRGSDIMIPMAIPAFGGMLIAAVTYFVVPVLYCLREEHKLKKQ